MLMGSIDSRYSSFEGDTAKPGLWTLDWTVDWTMDWTCDDHYQFPRLRKETTSVYFGHVMTHG